LLIAGSRAVKEKHLNKRLFKGRVRQIISSRSAQYRALCAVTACLFFVALAGSIAAAASPSQTESNVPALLEQARSQEKAEDYAAAERTYRQALLASPDDLEVLKRLGILEQTELKFDDSIRLFTQVLASNAQYPEVNFFLGVSYFGKNDLAPSIESFQRELNTAKPHPRSHYYLALALEASGRVDEAISQLNQSIAQNPKDADALYELARLYKNASLRAIEMLKALDPDSFRLHALMGEVDADQEHYSEAIKEYQAALAKRPDAPGMYYAIGIAYWAQKQMQPAEKAFREAWKENPNDALTNLYLGDIALRDQRFSDALAFLLVAQRGQPHMSQVHLLLGKYYQGQKELEKAKTEFLAAIDTDPAAAQPHYLLAKIYRELHDAQASAAELAQFERLSKLKNETPLQSNPQN